MFLLLLAALSQAALSRPATTAPAAAQTTPHRLLLERVVMVMRHGVRAPIDGEVPADTHTGAPWPHWPVAAEQMTPHGLAALELRGADDRAWLDRSGLFTPGRCPAPTTVRIHSNVSQRTIDSANAFARGFAPGCGLTVDHQAAGTVDPLFEPLRDRNARFDAAAAMASIDLHTGGMDALTRRHRAELDALDRVLDCPQRVACTPRDAASVRASADGRSIVLTGPIRRASGIAQVLLLQYVQGMPAAQVGWGRVDAAALKRLGALHAALFDVFTRAPYMAAKQAGPLARAMLAALEAHGDRRLDLFVGHDTNVTALAAALRVDLSSPDYATGDVPPDGALVLTLLRDPATGARFVRTSYRVQPIMALRYLQSGIDDVVLRVPGCSATCPLDRFATLLMMRTAAAG
ncbi:histidine-type phosphatase [Sphingomonas beigongshangi]|uniref:histidine-type phosphatase n=1 Tax=Sphingomonas beigongshangi TaxID=2782540 RepID=UPI00193B5951|nr:histidine-type phosphatase [Sphingomonas beigongshangi]